MSLEVYQIIFYREVLSFPFCFYPPLLDYDVSMYILVDLVVMIPTSQKSSKTESGYERYARFRFALSAVFRGAEFPGFRPEVPGKATGKVPARVQYLFLGHTGRSGGSGSSGRGIVQPSSALTEQWRGLVFLQLIWCLNTLLNPVILKKLSAFLTGVMLWRLSFLLFKTMVLGD